MEFGGANVIDLADVYARAAARAGEWRPEQPRDLGCPLTGVDYEHATGTATLRLPAHCCVDMGGAIEFCTSRFPHVRRIVTVAGTELDTCYFRDAAGRWSVERVGDAW